MESQRSLLCRNHMHDCSCGRETMAKAVELGHSSTSSTPKQIPRKICMHHQKLWRRTGRAAGALRHPTPPKGTPYPCRRRRHHSQSQPITANHTHHSPSQHITAHHSTSQPITTHHTTSQDIITCCSEPALDAAMGKATRCAPPPLLMMLFLTSW